MPELSRFYGIVIRMFYSERGERLATCNRSTALIRCNNWYRLSFHPCEINMPRTGLCVDGREGELSPCGSLR
jgi:hypothetical protein